MKLYDLTASPWRAWIANGQPTRPSLIQRLRFWILARLEGK